MNPPSFSLPSLLPSRFAQLTLLSVFLLNVGIAGPLNFYEPQNIYSDWATALELADINGDGRKDIIYAEEHLLYWIPRLENQFGQRIPIATQITRRIHEIRVADIDNDDDNDIVLSESGDGIFIIRNNGNVSLDSPEEWDWTSIGQHLFELADFDADGDFDLLQATNGLVYVDENDGNGALHRENWWSIASKYTYTLLSLYGPGYLDENIVRHPEEVAVGDFNGDGFKDVVILSTVGVSSNLLDIMYNVGNHQHDTYASAWDHKYSDSVFRQNRFTTLENFLSLELSISYKRISAAPVDDQEGDEIIAIRGSQLVWWNGNEDRPHLIANVDFYSKYAAGDLDGDGDTDFVIATRSGLGYRLNDGSGNFSASNLLDDAFDQDQHFVRFIIIEDLNGDGRGDIIIQDNDEPMIRAYYSAAEADGGTWYAGASYLADDWRYLDWFKGFKPEAGKWIYHGRHGWLYVLADDTSGMFLWDVALGRWMFTSEIAYPWMYAYGPHAGWVFFFEGGQPGSRYFKRGDTGVVVSEQNLAND